MFISISSLWKPTADISAVATRPTAICRTCSPTRVTPALSNMVTSHQCYLVHCNCITVNMSAPLHNPGRTEHCSGPGQVDLCWTWSHTTHCHCPVQPETCTLFSLDTGWDGCQVGGTMCQVPALHSTLFTWNLQLYSLDYVWYTHIPGRPLLYHYRKIVKQELRCVTGGWWVPSC